MFHLEGQLRFLGLATVKGKANSGANNNSQQQQQNSTKEMLLVMYVSQRASTIMLGCDGMRKKVDF